MSAHEVNTAPTEGMATMPDTIYRATDAAASLIKLATLAALDQTPSEFVGSLELCKRIDALQEKWSGWKMATAEARSLPLKYCATTLQPTSLVETKLTDGVRGRVRMAKITPFGSDLWPAMAETYLPWEQRHPDLSLKDVIGASKSALNQGASTRLRMLQHLLLQPEGSAPLADIYQTLGISQGVISRTVNELCITGILTSRTKFGPDQRRYTLGEPATAVSYYPLRKPELQLVMNGVLALREDGIYEASGLEIIRRTKELQPDLDAKSVWKQFRDWVRNSHRPGRTPLFVKEIDTIDDTKVRSEIQVAEHCIEPIKELLNFRRRIATDADFRKAAAVAPVYFTNKQRVSAHMRRAKRESHASAGTSELEWEALLYENVPPEGISMDSLYASIVAGSAKRITRSTAMRYIFNLTDMVRVVNRPVLEGVVQKPHVLLKKHAFPAKWIDRALCKTRSLDPAMFQGQPSTPAGDAKTKEAIDYCLRCPVRRACLKTAVENTELEGVWGGMTAEAIERLSPVQKENIRATIQIGR